MIRYSSYILLTSFLVALPLRGERWVKTTSGCQIEAEEMILQTALSLTTNERWLGERPLYATWTGRCENGKAEGTGTVTLLDSAPTNSWPANQRLWWETYTGDNGVMRKEGLLVSTVDPTTVDVRFFECQKGPSGRRWVAAAIRPTVDLAFLPALKSVADVAKDFANQNCPNGTKDSHRLELFIYRQPAPEKFVRWQSFRASDRPWITNCKGGRHETWAGDFRAELRDACQDYTFDERRSEISQIRSAEVQATLREAKLAQQRKQEQEEANRNALLRRQFDGFMKRSSVSSWPSAADVCTNPYRFQKARLGLIAMFQRMAGPNVAVISVGACLGALSGVPSTLFGRPTEIVVAVEVLGMQNAVLSLRYVDSLACQRSPCEYGSFARSSR